MLEWTGQCWDMLLNQLSCWAFPRIWSHSRQYHPTTLQGPHFWSNNTNAMHMWLQSLEMECPLHMSCTMLSNKWLALRVVIQGSKGNRIEVFSLKIKKINYLQSRKSLLAYWKIMTKKCPCTYDTSSNFSHSPILNVVPSLKTHHCCSWKPNLNV